MLATDAFHPLAVESARNEGIEHARILTVPHPIGGETERALYAKADHALEALLALAAQT